MLKALRTYRLTSPIVSKLLNPTSTNAAVTKNLLKKSEIHTSALRLGGGDHEFVHRDTPENNENTLFDFTKENYEVKF
jgi:hypothetical protein